MDEEEYVDLENSKDERKAATKEPRKAKTEAKKKEASYATNGEAKAAIPAKKPVAKPEWKEPAKPTYKQKEKVEEKPPGEAVVPEKKAGKKPKAKSEMVRNKKIEKITDHVETDVDKLYEIVRDKGILKVKEASKMLGIDMDQVEEWGRILEEHKLVRLRYPPVGEPVLILKRFTTDSEKIQKLKGGKKLKPKRRVFIINIIILVFFLAVIAIFTIRIPTIRITYVQAYLAVGVIIIIGAVFVFRAVRGRKNAGKKDAKSEEKSGEKAD